MNIGRRLARPEAARPPDRQPTVPQPRIRARSAGCRPGSLQPSSSPKASPGARPTSPADPPGVPSQETVCPRGRRADRQPARPLRAKPGDRGAATTPAAPPPLTAAISAAPAVPFTYDGLSTSPRPERERVGDSGPCEPSPSSLHLRLSAYSAENDRVDRVERSRRSLPRSDAGRQLLPTLCSTGAGWVKGSNPQGFGAADPSLSRARRDAHDE
jgi:hypothetical protein